MTATDRDDFTRLEESSQLPDELAELQDLADTWVCGGDRERSDRIEAASDDDLRALLDRVTPHFAAIDALPTYVDGDETGELVEPLLNAARLAEAAAEARVELDRRASR
jgi:hypothetical protein